MAQLVSRKMQIKLFSQSYTSKSVLFAISELCPLSAILHNDRLGLPVLCELFSSGRDSCVARYKAAKY